MIKSSKIIEVSITPDMKRVALEKSREMGLIKNSILKSEGNETGFLGEEVIKWWLGDKGEVSGRNTYEYDFLFNSKRCEVKTKLTTVVPKSHYDCSVANYNPNQKCDFYIFVRVMSSSDKAWILGYISKDEFFRNSVFLMKGDLDPSNNYTVKADCYNIKISSLLDIKNLPNE